MGQELVLGLETEWSFGYEARAKTGVTGVVKVPLSTIHITTWEWGDIFVNISTWLL